MRYITKHSRSLAGREMMMRSFFANSVTKATSELSERSKAWRTETYRQSESGKININSDIIHKITLKSLKYHLYANTALQSVKRENEWQKCEVSEYLLMKTTANMVKPKPGNQPADLAATVG